MGIDIPQPLLASQHDIGAGSAFMRRVLVLAPTANDGNITRKVLKKHEIEAVLCRNVSVLCSEMEMPFGAVLLAEEALTGETITTLVASVVKQPEWSDIPLIIVTSGGEANQLRLRQLASFGPGCNVTLIERPFGKRTLVSTLESAFRSRSRQYQVRDLLENINASNTERTRLLEETSAARDASERANRAKDDFLAALSHELRTPLNPVLLLATEAANDTNLTHELRSDFEMIAKNVKLEAMLIDDLLDLTRITRGKLALNMQAADLHTVLSDAISNVKADVEEKQIQLTLEMSARLSRVKCDPVRLQQVFWNVLKNAVKFTDTGGRITIRTTQNAALDGILVEVTDSGAGMTQAEIARIFDAFVQGDHAEIIGIHRFGGLGLGLAISRTLVGLHSGNIRASSPGLGHGSTFSIEIPLLISEGRRNSSIDYPLASSETAEIAASRSTASKLRT